MAVIVIKEAQLILYKSPASPSGVTGVGIRNWSPETCSACRFNREGCLIAFFSWVLGNWVPFFLELFRSWRLSGDVISQF